MRSIARTLDISFNTVKKMLQDAGTVCEVYHDQTVRNVAAERVPCDEMWSFCYAKNKTVLSAEEPLGLSEAGDVWTWTAIDPGTKLLIAWHVGDRSMTSGKAFLGDLRARLDLKEPVHLTSDQYSVYWEAVDDVFGEEAEHYLLKKYQREQGDATTAHIERHNLTHAMAAGLTNTLHDMEWLAELIEDAQPKPNRPKTYKTQPKARTT